jgi:hypothetical protein
MGMILDLVIKKNISGTLNLIKLNLPTSKSTKYQFRSRYK